MDISTITKNFISEISDEIKKEDNIISIKDDILNPIISHIIDEVYPYFLKITIFIIFVFVFILITLFLNLRIVFSY
jgi:hypothetical protein|tara:strand:+ start:557 stop:784 length:228 start_codon:yes stop_codon:yes gene_type:complete